MSKRKVTINEKLQIINHLDDGHSIRETADHFRVSKGVVQNAKKQRTELKSHQRDNLNTSMSKIYGSSEVNTLLWRWFKIARSQHFPLSAPLLKAKALQLNTALGAGSIFKASEGWFQAWKKRHNISFRTICGESENANSDSAEAWKQVLGNICKNYHPNNIFNMDETGYFFRALPTKTLAVKNEACKGGKKSKDRITIALTCSMNGEKLPPLIIGKSKQPRCFRNKNINKLPCVYRSSNKAWMTNQIFNDFLLYINTKMNRSNRKILLFVDNAPVHIVDNQTKAKLGNVDVTYFPPNLTSLVQPLDAGIIRSFKARARKFSVLKILSAIDKGIADHAYELAHQFTILDAIRFAAQSWDEVTHSTIQACFQNCGFVFTDIVSSNLEDLVEAELQELVSEIEEGEVIFEDELECFESIDENNVVDYLISEHKHSINDGGAEADDNDTVIDVDDVPKHISSHDAMQCLQKVVQYFEENNMVIEAGAALGLHRKAMQNSSTKQVQQSITKFFK